MCIIIEVTQSCPGSLFTFLEIVINTALVLEVAIRLIAQGQVYFRYIANVLDMILVALCILTLTYIGHKCEAGTKLEEELDTILLILRNGAQFFRLYLLMKRNQSGGGRPNYINIQASNISGAAGTSLSDDEFSFV